MNKDFRPKIFDPRRPQDKAKLVALKRSGKIISVSDIFDDQLKELSAVVGELVKADDIWVYYPWRGALTRILNENNFKRLRLSRNLNLILPAEQKKFAATRIGIAGLNVGNPAALCIALEGGGERMKFADNDILALSNFNRFRASLADLGVNKAILTARQVYEINPFADIEVFSDGVQPGRAEKFLLNPKIDVLVEEMDNLPLKIEIREKAREYRIPVVMVTGNGANIIIDIERFDIEPNLPLMSGYLKPAIIKAVKNLTAPLAFEEKMRLARDFMGSKFLVKRLRDSFPLVGKTLAGIPQLAEASFLRGAAVCWFVRQIATGAKVPSGRYVLKLDGITQKGKI